MESVVLGNLKEHSYAMKESLRALKTNLRFCGDDIKTILITSSVPDEGKSTVSVDLARSLTESGKSVLLIDTDMRKSVMVGRLRVKAAKGEVYGLSHYLSGQRKLEEVLYATDAKRLFMVFAGPSVPNPTEILEKKYFNKLIEFGREHFDYVIVDCAPIAAAIDAAVVAKRCDASLMVVSYDTTSRIEARKMIAQLKNANPNFLGVVLNKVRVNESSYYYKRYGSYYGKKDGDYGYY